MQRFSRRMLGRVGLASVATMVVAAGMCGSAFGSTGGKSNAGDVWVDNVGQPPGPGNEMDPHLGCADINLWGAGLADSSGTYTIDGWPPSGSQEQDYAANWKYDSTTGGTQVLDVISVGTLIANATANGDAPVNKQGFHFKLQFSQDPQKHKTFWVKCPALPAAYVGYADTRGSGEGFGIPSPWNGDSGVTFVGLVPGKGNSEPYYDSGALRFVDPSGSRASLTFTQASVTIGICTYTPWAGLNKTIQPGQQLILTETGRPAACGHNDPNFDTSDSYDNSPQFTQTPACQPDGWIPKITVTINGTPMTYEDTQQILNTGGVDLTTCLHDGTFYGEFHDWVGVG